MKKREDYRIRQKNKYFVNERLRNGKVVKTISLHPKKTFLILEKEKNNEKDVETLPQRIIEEIW